MQKFHKHPFGVRGFKAGQALYPLSDTLYVYASGITQNISKAWYPMDMYR